MRKGLARFMRDQSGEDLIEYGLMAAFAASLATAAILLDPELRNAIRVGYQKARDALDNS